MSQLTIMCMLIYFMPDGDVYDVDQAMSKLTIMCFTNFVMPDSDVHDVNQAMIFHRGVTACSTTASSQHRQFFKVVATCSTMTRSQQPVMLLVGRGLPTVRSQHIDGPFASHIDGLQRRETCRGQPFSTQWTAATATLLTTVSLLSGSWQGSGPCTMTERHEGREGLRDGGLCVDDVVKTSLAMQDAYSPWFDKPRISRREDTKLQRSYPDRGNQ